MNKNVSTYIKLWLILFDFADIYNIKRYYFCQKQKESFRNKLHGLPPLAAQTN